MDQESGQLTIELEGNVVGTYQLSAGVLTMGRAPDNGLPLPHQRVSRQHAELRVGPEGVVLTDLGSSNGTYVQGQRILPHQPYLLVHGTVFQVGPYVFTYYAPALLHQPAPDTPPQVAPPPPEPEPAFAAFDPLSVPVPPAPPAPVPEPAPAPAFPAAEFARLPAPPPLPPRPAWPAPAASARVSDYLQYLPIIFQDNDFLGRYLLLFQSTWEPLEQRQDHIDAYFSPATCPASFLPWLASWVDPALNTQWPEARVRKLLAEAMDLYRWRGTRYGVARMIELCTGLAPQIVEDPVVPFVFRVRVAVPAESGVDRRLIEGLIQTQKPAHAGYVLEMVPA